MLETQCKMQEVVEINSTERRMSYAVIASIYCVPQRIFT